MKSLKNAALLMAATLFTVAAWIYMDRILVAYQVRDAAAQERPRGNLSDLYPRWLGARELLLHGRDPYSHEVTREIQQGYYGRELDPQRSGDPQDQAGFAYPIYVAFLLAPTVRLPFPAVQAIFIKLLWILCAVSVLLWLRVMRWKPSISTSLILIVLALGSLPVIQAIKLQQLTLVVAALLSGTFAALAVGYLALAGLLLALATIKPQLALLPCLWLMAWTLGEWRERKRLMISFAVVMFALLLGAELELPGWIGRFLIAMREYHVYMHNLSLLQILTNPTFGYVLAAALLGLSAWLCWPSLCESTGSQKFAYATSLILALVVLTVPMFALYNQILLLPALLAIVHEWPQTTPSRASRFAGLTLAILLIWPWIASLALDCALFFLPATTVQNHWKLPFFTTFALPPVVFAILALQIARHNRLGIVKTVDRA